MATYVYYVEKCGNCSASLGCILEGIIGPERFRCRKCGTVIDSDFRPWSSLSLLGKIGGIIRELLAPSFIPVNVVGAFFVSLFFWMMSAAMGLLSVMLICAYLPAMCLVESDTLTPVLAFAYPAYLVARLVKKIRRSGQFRRSGTRPTFSLRNHFF